MSSSDIIIIALCGVIIAQAWAMRQSHRQFEELADMMDKAMATLAIYKEALALIDRNAQYWKAQAAEKATQ